MRSDKLAPDPRDVAEAIAFSLRFEGQKRAHDARVFGCPAGREAFGAALLASTCPASTQRLCPSDISQLGAYVGPDKVNLAKLDAA